MNQKLKIFSALSLEKKNVIKNGVNFFPDLNICGIYVSQVKTNNGINMGWLVGDDKEN